MMMKIAIGIDIGGTNTKIILASEDGKVLQSGKFPTLASPGAGAERFEDILIKNIRDFLNDEKTGTLISNEKIAGIGLGIAGIIDRKNGKIVKSPNIASADGLSIREIIEKEFSLPVIIENDANAYAYGERWIGAGRQIESFIVLTLGTGLGGGHIYNRELYEGPFEVGHIIIEPQGRFCPCGSHGCLESYASGRAIIDKAISSIESGTKSSLVGCCDGNYYKITPELVFQEALEGDNLSREIFREVGHYLGMGLANLINIVSLDAVIIGGGLIGAWDLFIEERPLNAALNPTHRILKFLKALWQKTPDP